MKKLIASLIVLTFVVGGMAACKSKTATTTDKPIIAVVGGEAQTLDPAINQSADASTYIVHLFEGLMKVDKNLGYVPGAAKAAPTISADKMTYTYTIRDDAKWSDGKDLKASDFVYAWQRDVNPATASAYAYQLYYIKNAAEINAQFINAAGQPAKAKLGKDGKPAKFKYDADKKVYVKDAKGNYIEDPDGMYVEDANGKFVQAKADGTAIWLDDLGVKATGDKTLVVTLNAPCNYFDQIVAFPTLFPVRKDVIDANPTDWFGKPETCIGNGPYKLTAWVHKSKITMEKNDNYYDASTITAKSLQFNLMDDANAAYAAYKTGSINVIQNLFPTEEIPSLKKTGDCVIYPFNGVYYYVFNTTKAPWNNAKVREAFTLAFDRNYVVDKITMGGQLPAGAFVAPGMQDATAGSDFRANGGNFFDPTAYAANVTKAKQLLAEAGYPDGKGFPAFELKFNTNVAHQKIAEYIMSEWKKNLGVSKVTLTPEDFPTLIADRNNKNYDVARDGWLGDYSDPMTFLDLATSTSGNNDSHFKSAEYDQLINTAKTTTDMAARSKALHDAEKLLVTSYSVCPIYYYTSPTLVKGVKGLVSSPMGYIYLMWASKS